MNKSIIQGGMIFILLIVLYLLGARISVNVGKVREIQEIEPPIHSPAIFHSPAPAPVYEEVVNEGLLGPYGYLTDKMVDDMNTYPHKNPMMYRKREKVLLNNLVE